MVKPPHIHAARREALRLVLERRALPGRGLVPSGVVVDLEAMSVRRLRAERPPMAEIALMPATAATALFERLNAAGERLRAARPEGDMTHAGLLRSGQFQGVEFVVVKAAQIDAA